MLGMPLSPLDCPCSASVKDLNRPFYLDLGHIKSLMFYGNGKTHAVCHCFSLASRLRTGHIKSLIFNDTSLCCLPSFCHCFSLSYLRLYWCLCGATVE
ncbi:hypothetical protein NPIL_58261 [Nephila pilipes]|uniref:Uncharacterized protein n=1 Tax=Nephila pilipes TaxID=299642 RepID=A0A8X6TJ42_NEPPI|nr:hypothetical protein NPIL_58261 [Nephila pilipes]